MIESLGGRYVTAEDVGMTDEDMQVIARRTRHVSRLPVAEGAAGGNPGPATALGVFLCLKAAARYTLGRLDVTGVPFPMQGLERVRPALARPHVADGAVVALADGDDKAARAT